MAKKIVTKARVRPSRFGRTYQFATSRYVLAPLVIIGLILIGFLFYYYNRYTQIIEAGLRGDIFVRSSGIYAAPLNVFDGSPVRVNSLVDHLKQVGYLEKGSAQNEKRGQFLARGNFVEIYPGPDSLIDGARLYRNIRVVFGRDGSVIQNITDLDSRQRLAQAQVEPELISSVINQEREKRKIIEFKDLPKSLVDSIVAIEDRQFFEHSGINWRGVLRALFRDYQAGEIREGGSSITQQLIKNFFLKPDRTWKRKLSEAYMSIILEQRLSKDEIMAMYCNQIYLGQRGGFSINGFGQAARAYFGKDISNLTLSESAMLAGIIRSPNYYSPNANEERTRERRNLVLEKMVEAGKISRAEADAAKRQPLGVKSGAGVVDASDGPYFVDFIMRQLESQYAYGGQSLRSLRIYSTIDLDLQRAAYQAVARNMAEVERLLAKRRGGTAGLQAALVAMNAKTGEILAMVGGRDYATSQLNRATDARRQPGSVFKPFVYATALELGGEGLDGSITPATMFVDEPKTFQFDGRPYDPGNFGDKYEMRPITLRDALVNSKNVITVEIAERIGFTQVQRMAEKAGLTKVPPYPSMALGVGEATPLQMASAYTSFANQGRRVAPLAVKRITGKDGATVFESKLDTREVMTPQVAYIMTSIMQDVLDRGTGTRVRQMGFSGVAAGKTGSSRDGWFAGYTPNIVCVVWVGFDDNADLGLTGGVSAAPIWADFMIRALQIRPELGGDFKPPEEGLITYEIDPVTGEAIEGSGNARRELFLKGTRPGGGVLPDSSLPDSEPPPEKTDIESGRPSQTAKPPGDDRMMSSIDDSTIPIPPEARRRQSGEGDIIPGPTPTQSPPSFFKKLATALGFSANVETAPTPTPTPWTNGGLGPANRPAIRNNSEIIPIPPEARRTIEQTPFTPTPTPVVAKSGTKVAPRVVKAAPQSTRPRRVTPTPTPKPRTTLKPILPRVVSKPVKAQPKASASKSKSKSKSKSTKKNATTVARNAKAAPAAKTPKAVKPVSTPTPRPTPVVVAAAPVPATPSPPQPGTFVLDVCAESNLLPVAGVCKTTVKRRYKLGAEPTTFCKLKHQ